MSRVVKAILILVAMLVFSAIVCVGAVFIISGGQPVDFVQTALIRLRLSSREEDLQRSISSDETPVRFTIESGDTPRVIAANLLDENLISDEELGVRENRRKCTIMYQIRLF